MKKIIRLSKGLLFVVLFIGIYSYITIQHEKDHYKYIMENKSSIDLNFLIKNLVDSTFNDSLNLTSYKEFDTSVVYIENHDSNYMNKFLKSKDIDYTERDNFFVDLYDIRDQYEDDKDLYEEYILEYNNLITRFPSKLIVGDKKQIK